MKAPISRFIQRARTLQAGRRTRLRLHGSGRRRVGADPHRPSGVSVNGNVIGDDVLYSIGGGRAVSMGGAGTCKASASGSAGTAT